MLRRGGCLLPLWYSGISYARPLFPPDLIHYKRILRSLRISVYPGTVYISFLRCVILLHSHNVENYIGLNSPGLSLILLPYLIHYGPPRPIKDLHYMIFSLRLGVLLMVYLLNDLLVLFYLVYKPLPPPLASFCRLRLEHHIVLIY